MPEEELEEAVSKLPAGYTYVSSFTSNKRQVDKNDPSVAYHIVLDQNSDVKKFTKDFSGELSVSETSELPTTEEETPVEESEDEDMDESMEIKESDEDEDESMDLKEAEGDEPSAPVNPEELANDLEMRKILNALKINPTAFARSLSASIADVEGNPVAGSSFEAILEILKAVADNPTIASRIAADLKNSRNSEVAPKTEGVDGTEEDDKNDIELMGMDENLIESVNQYLTYVAESWVEDNQLAVEQGLKTEITESFLAGLKNLFVEHNINVPEETAVVDALVAKVATLEEAVKTTTETMTKKLNEEAARAIRFKKKLNEQVATNIVDSVSYASKLSLTQKEKFKTLAESVEFTDEKTYREKLSKLVETVGNDKKAPKVRLNEESMQTGDESEKPLTNDPIMSAYAKAISNKSTF
jgi:hypothetical protein